MISLFIYQLFCCSPMCWSHEEEKNKSRLLIFCARIARVCDQPAQTHTRSSNSGSVLSAFSPSPKPGSKHKRFFTCCSRRAPSHTSSTFFYSPMPIMVNHCRDYSAILIRNRIRVWRSLEVEFFPFISMRQKTFSFRDN